MARGPAAISRFIWSDLWLGLSVLAIASGILTGQAIFIVFGVIGLVAGAVSWFWNGVALEQLYYQRHLPQRRALIGEEVPMTVTLTNSKPVPLSRVLVEDEIPFSLRVVGGEVDVDEITETQTLRHSTSMAWYERIRWDYRLRCTRRGLYRLGPASISSGDPFGFLRSRKSGPQQDTLLVFPRIVPLRELGMPAFRPLGEVRGGIRIFRDPSRPSGLREYQWGDPMNTVNWKATAKMRRLHVRTFDPSSTVTIILVVAVDVKAPYWQTFFAEDLKRLDRVITAASSVASYATEQQYVVGLFTNDMPTVAHRPMTVPPGRGREQLGVILETLAGVRAYASAPMASQLAANARRFPVGATLVVSTAFLHPQFVDTLGNLKHQGHKIVVLYVGEEDCPELPEGVLVYDLRDRIRRLEEADEFGPG